MQQCPSATSNPPTPRYYKVGLSASLLETGFITLVCALNNSLRVSHSFLEIYVDRHVRKTRVVYRAHDAR